MGFSAFEFFIPPLINRQVNESFSRPACFRQGSDSRNVYSDKYAILVTGLTAKGNVALFDDFFFLLCCKLCDQADDFLKSKIFMIGPNMAPFDTNVTTTFGHGWFAMKHLWFQIGDRKSIVRMHYCMILR